MCWYGACRIHSFRKGIRFVSLGWALSSGLEWYQVSKAISKSPDCGNWEGSEGEVVLGWYEDEDDEEDEDMEEIGMGNKYGEVGR